MVVNQVITGGALAIALKFRMIQIHFRISFRASMCYDTRRGIPGNRQPEFQTENLEDAEKTFTVYEKPVLQIVSHVYGNPAKR